MAKKGPWDVIFLIMLGIVLLFITPGIPFDEMAAFGLAFLRVVT